VTSLMQVALLLAQVVLLALHYGNSQIAGVNWASLPWFVVWFPMIVLIIATIIQVIIIGIIVSN